MMDRIDLKVLVSSHDHTQRNQASYASSTVKQIITRARKLQKERLRGARFANLNADISNATRFRDLTPRMSPSVEDRLAGLDQELDLTKRMQVKLRLVALTIADVENARTIRVRDVEEAVDLMGLRDEYFRSMT